jgi:hypothetical protein
MLGDVATPSFAEGLGRPGFQLSGRQACSAGTGRPGGGLSVPVGRCDGASSSTDQSAQRESADLVLLDQCLQTRSAIDTWNPPIQTRRNLL